MTGPLVLRAPDEAAQQLAGFEHVNPLGTYDFSSERPAGPLRPLPHSDRSVKFD